MSELPLDGPVVPRPRTVTVTGSGTASAPADTARLRLRADAVRATASEALAAADACVRRVRTALEAHGLRATTGDLGLHSEQGWSSGPDGSRSRSRNGFRATHGLRTALDLTTADLGTVLAEALDAGGDDVALDGVELGIGDTAALRRDARLLAWLDARSAAAEHAGAAGRRLGGVLDVVEGSGGGGPRPVGRGAAVASFSVDAGDSDVVVQLTITWELV